MSKDLLIAINELSSATTAILKAISHLPGVDGVEVKKALTHLENFTVAFAPVVKAAVKEGK